MTESRMKHEFDLADFDLGALAEAGAPLTLCHPKTKEALPVRIWLQGEDAASYRALLRQQLDRHLADPKAELKAADLEERLIERLAALTVRWDNMIEDGEALPCTTEAARQIYQHHLWIREQVSRFVEERANFLP
jgi:hypothetical protein